MARITATFSVSLPPEMAAQLGQVQKEEHRTRSELVREALRQYFRHRKDSRDPTLSQRFFV
jgi:metal-responsive CopG/Arc/MetJ family transcriptional regulator